MCKLFAIIDIENEKLAEKFGKAAVPFITKSDNHGLGIMRLGERGIHIQRWLNVPSVVRRTVDPYTEKYKLALAGQSNEEGNKSRRLYAMGIHGRFATCERSLQNTHPFYFGGTALMHNGIISNVKDFKQTLSTCDSEILLHQYLKHNVRKNPQNLETALDGVAGYYAGIVFNDNGTVTIFRDSSATLFLGHVKGVGIVVATTKEITQLTARYLKLRISSLDEVVPCSYIHWNPVNRIPQIGTFEELKPFTPVAAIEPQNHWWNEKNEDAMEHIKDLKDTPLDPLDDETLTAEELLKAYDEQSPKRYHL